MNRTGSKGKNAAKAKTPNKSEEKKQKAVDKKAEASEKKNDKKDAKKASPAKDRKSAHLTLTSAGKSSKSAGKDSTKKTVKEVDRTKVPPKYEGVKPKRPVNAYFAFNNERSAEIREEWKKDNRKIEIGTIGKQVKEEWDQLSEKDIEKYKKVAEDDKARYLKQIAQIHDKGYFKLPDGTKSSEVAPPEKKKKRGRSSGKKTAKDLDDYETDKDKKKRKKSGKSSAKEPASKKRETFSKQKAKTDKKKADKAKKVAESGKKKQKKDDDDGLSLEEEASE